MENLITKFAATNNVTKIDEIKGAGSDLTGSVTDILNAVIAVLATVAVIVIVIGGVGYMTSTGDAGKVKKAKDTILYGVIGLVICALAAAIVNFVIASIINRG